jgi:hypothetical protein
MRRLREEIRDYAAQLLAVQRKLADAPDAVTAAPIGARGGSSSSAGRWRPHQLPDWDSTPTSGPSGMPPPPVRLPVRPTRMRKALGGVADSSNAASRPRPGAGPTAAPSHHHHHHLQHHLQPSGQVAAPAAATGKAAEEAASAERRRVLTDILAVLCDERLQKATAANGGRFTADVVRHALQQHESAFER